MSAKISSADRFLKQYYSVMPYEDYTILDRAVRTIEANSAPGRPNDNLPWHPMRGIVPSDGYFAGVWNWDCAFHAIGAAHWDAELAKDQIRIFCNMQQPDGMFPDVMRSDRSLIFIGCSKPPLMPWAVWNIEQYEHDDDFLKRAYNAFIRNENFWMEKRGGKEYGLFHYDGCAVENVDRQLYAGWESGWDNSPRWDNGVNQIFALDLNCYMVIFYHCMAYFAERLDRAEEKKIWRDKETVLRERIENTFWDENADCYLDFDFRRNSFVQTITPASFMPLFIKTASAERAERMAEIAKVHFFPGWPSVSYRHREFDPEGYWRGRTWLNIAYFALKGLKNYRFTEISEAGRQTMLDWVHQSPGAIYENYNSATTLPVGCPRFSWSAVFCIKFLLDWEKEEF